MCRNGTLCGMSTEEERLREKLSKLEADRDEIEAKLKKKRAEANTNIARIRHRISAKERKDDTRRKILVGSMMLERVKDNPTTRPALLSDLDAYLDRDRDRALFDLRPKEASE